VTPCPLCRHPLARPLFEKAGYPYERCRGCGLVTRGGAEGPPSYHDYLPAETRSLPDLTRKRYDELLTRFDRYRRTGRFYDVGCGGGFLVEAAAERGWQAEGLEVSSSAVEFGRARGLTLHCGTLADVRPDEGIHDVVTMMEVIEHVREPVALLRQAGALLRPGGALYLTTPNWGSLTRRCVGFEWAPIGRDHLLYLTPAHLRRALRSAGLEPVRVTSANVEPHQILARFRRRGSAADSTASAGADRWRDVERTRASLERNAFLRFAKGAANAALGISDLGDTVRALAVRPGDSDGALSRE